MHIGFHLTGFIDNNKPLSFLSLHFCYLLLPDFCPLYFLPPLSYKAIHFHITHSKNERNFRAHFGLPSLCVEQLWRLILQYYPHLPREWGLEELFLTLYFLKSPGRNFETIASHFHIHPQTMVKWVDLTLTIIIGVLPEV